MPEHDTYSLVLGCAVEEIRQRRIHASGQRVLFFRTVQFNTKDACRTFGNDVTHHCFPAFLEISGRLATSDCCPEGLGRPCTARAYAARSLDRGMAPLARKPSICFASNPSSLRTSSLCSPTSGARLAATLLTPCT